MNSGLIDKIDDLIEKSREDLAQVREKFLMTLWKWTGKRAFL